MDDTLLILLNADHTPPFTLPAHKRGVRWQQLLDTDARGVSPRHVTVLKGGERYEVEARSVRVLRLRPAGSTRRDLRSVVHRDNQRQGPPLGRFGADSHRLTKCLPRAVSKRRFSPAGCPIPRVPWSFLARPILQSSPLQRQTFSSTFQATDCIALTLQNGVVRVSKDGFKHAGSLAASHCF